MKAKGSVAFYAVRAQKVKGDHAGNPHTWLIIPHILSIIPHILIDYSAHMIDRIFILALSIQQSWILSKFIEIRFSISLDYNLEVI